MRADADTSSTGTDWADKTTSSAGWSWKVMLILIVLALAVHLGLIFIFGARKPVPILPAVHVPQLHLILGHRELMALDDPTLFAVPHVEDFVPAVWRAMPEISPPTFRWTEPPPFLQPPAKTLGSTFNQFMQTNHFAGIQLNLKPAPALPVPAVPLPSLLPKHSTWRLTGELKHRTLLSAPVMKSLHYDDILRPSRVQLLVDQSGRVVSDVLLDSSDYGDADALALKIARAVRFAPANRLMFGDLIIYWHTLPVPTTKPHSAAKKAP